VSTESSGSDFSLGKRRHKEKKENEKAVKKKTKEGEQKDNDSTTKQPSVSTLPCQS
jgi:hypothetical protein